MEKEKVGSLLHLIAKKSKVIYLTRLLKLIYLIDEKSILEIGVPVTSFEYRVAENGPLVVDLWNNLKNSNLFYKYITVTKDSIEDGYKITPVGEPDETLFSEYELELINNTVRDYRGYSTRELIDHIHEKDNSLWKDIVFKNSISFEITKLSEHIIDFRDLIKDNETLSSFYDTYRITR